MVSPAFRMTAAAVALATALAGCGQGETLRLYEPLTVKEAVPVRVEPPPELATPYGGVPLPRFMTLADPQAAVCLSADGVKALLGIVSDLRGRDTAWREWAATPISRTAEGAKP